MAANDAALAPQPDFNVIAHQFNDLSVQFQRCSNIPAIQGANAILEALADIRADMRAMRNEMRTMRGEMQQGFAKQETLHRNQQARLENNQLFRAPDHPLCPLFSVRDNQPIPNFPQTPAEIDTLAGRPLDALLDHLGIPSPAQVARKRAVFKKAIGVFGRYIGAEE